MDVPAPQPKSLPKIYPHQPQALAVLLPTTPLLVPQQVFYSLQVETDPTTGGKQEQALVPEAL
jgi:hypothetical protein